MKKNTHSLLKLITIGCLALSLIVVASCGSRQNNEAVASETETQALVIYAQGGDYLFVDTETDTLFFPTLTDAVITNSSGQSASLENLAVGDMVTITGDGAMTMSYPAFYPGITRVQIDSRGNMDEVAEYSDTILTIFPPVSESDVPVGWLDYNTSVGNIILTLNPYNYQGFANSNAGVSEQQLDGSYADENGIISELINDARFIGSTEATAGFSSNIQSVTIQRVPLETFEEERLHIDLFAPQESVSSSIIGDSEFSFTIEPDYLYIVDAKFANGEAHYAFATLKY